MLGRHVGRPVTRLMGRRMEYLMGQLCGNP